VAVIVLRPGNLFAQITHAHLHGTASAGAAVENLYQNNKGCTFLVVQWEKRLSMRNSSHGMNKPFYGCE
jgi:hypothetical protein